MININYVAGPVGSGKTYSAIQYITSNSTNKYLYCCPTQELCRQVASDIKQANMMLQVQTIYDDGQHRETVSGRITNHFKTTGGQGEVLIITHAAYERVRFFQSAARWDIIWDEAPQVVWYEGIKLAQHASLLLDMIDKPVSISSSYSLIEEQADGGTSSTMLGDRTGDSVCTLLRPFAGRLLHKDWITYVDSEQFEAFSINRDNPGTGDHRLDVLGLLQPTMFEGFKSVTILAAHFESTLACLYWSTLGTVEFRAHPVIKPRVMKVPNGHLISVFYLVEQAYSKNMGRKLVDGLNVSVNDAMEATAFDLIKDHPHVILRNKDYKAWYDDVEAIDLPHSSHGLNSFSHVDIAWVHAALNPPPVVFNFIFEITGIEGDAVRTATAHHQMLQAVGRCSIRDYSNTNERTIIVPDRDTAEFISASLSAKVCSPLTDMNLAPAGKAVGRTRIHTTDAARLVAFRQRKNDLAISEINKLNQLVSPIEMVETNPLYNKGNRFNHFGTVFANTKTSEATDEITCDTKDEFIQLLRELAIEPIEKKEQRALISPAKFRLIHGVKEKRGIVNVVSASGIWLDNDGGELSPEQFASIFPHIEMFIWNTFSSTKEKPRWRVYIPTSLRTGVISYKALTAEIARKLERKGFYHDVTKTKKPDVKKSGFDGSKLKPSDLFYLPSTNASRPDDAFFLEFKGGNRSVLNPLDWIKHSQPKVEVQPEPIVVKPVVEIDYSTMSDQKTRLVKALRAKDQDGAVERRERTVARAEAHWQGSTAGEGHLAFFKLAATYHRAGLDAFDAQSRLYNQAFMGRSREERKREIKGLIQKLWR